MILVDTSVWVGVFRRRDPIDIDTIVDFGDLTTCPPIVQEVLQGIGDPDAWRLARDAMLALPVLESPMSMEVWLEASQLYRTARASGVTVRSGIDCLIAACALRHDFEVLHHDRDFTNLARVSPLRQRTP